jgi:hypothetical protein
MRHYDRASAELNQALGVGPTASFHVAWRAFAGAAWRAAPDDRLFDAVQATPLETLDRFHWNAGGPLRESEHFWAEGGGGLRGYVGLSLSGDRLLAGSLELKHDNWPILIFADVARIERTGSGSYVPYGPTFADAGVGWDAGFVRIFAPIWVSAPPSGEGEFAARWVVAFDLPDLRFR